MSVTVNRLPSSVVISVEDRKVTVNNADLVLSAAVLKETKNRRAFGGLVTKLSKVLTKHGFKVREKAKRNALVKGVCNSLTSHGLLVRTQDPNGRFEYFEVAKDSEDFVTAIVAEAKTVKVPVVAAGAGKASEGKGSVGRPRKYATVEDISALKAEVAELREAVKVLTEAAAAVAVEDDSLVDSVPCEPDSDTGLECLTAADVAELEAEIAAEGAVAE